MISKVSPILAIQAKQYDAANGGLGGSSGPIIDVANVGLTLTSRAGAVQILKDVTLAVTPGQSMAIVGPSGSGKTSLLMVVAGLERATAGRVNIVGQVFYPVERGRACVGAWARYRHRLSIIPFWYRP